MNLERINPNKAIKTYPLLCGEEGLESTVLPKILERIRNHNRRVDMQEATVSVENQKRKMKQLIIDGAQARKEFDSSS